MTIVIEKAMIHLYIDEPGQMGKFAEFRCLLDWPIGFIKFRPTLLYPLFCWPLCVYVQSKLSNWLYALQLQLPSDDERVKARQQLLCPCRPCRAGQLIYKVFPGNAPFAEFYKFNFVSLVPLKIYTRPCHNRTTGHSYSVEHGHVASNWVSLYYTIHAPGPSGPKSSLRMKDKSERDFKQKKLFNVVVVLFDYEGEDDRKYWLIGS